MISEAVPPESSWCAISDERSTCRYLARLFKICLGGRPFEQKNAVSRIPCEAKFVLALLALIFLPTICTRNLAAHKKKKGHDVSITPIMVDDQVNGTIARRPMQTSANGAID